MQNNTVREAAKKVSPLVARPLSKNHSLKSLKAKLTKKVPMVTKLGGGGWGGGVGKALVAFPQEEELFLRLP